MRRTPSLRSFAALLVAGVLASVPLAYAKGTPRYGSVLLTDDQKTHATKAVFTPSTPELFAVATLVDVVPGTTLKAVWIAEKTVAPPNYVIDQAEQKVPDTSFKQVTFNLSKPGAGWPVGDYRVELYIDGKLSQMLKFRVAG